MNKDRLLEKLLSDTESEKPENNADSSVEQDNEENQEEIQLPEIDIPSNTEDQVQAEQVLQQQEMPSVLDKAPYHERYYLHYCGAKCASELDLTGTKSFLRDLGFDGGELRQARMGRERSENFANLDSGQMRCSYCGCEILGVEFYRMPDGRTRCTSCSNSIVKTKDEIEQIYNRVVLNMENFFGATIDVPVSVEVLEERKLKKKIGVPLGETDDQSILILGVATEKKKKYSVLMENGAPRVSVIATFAHELTHIWQYTHWDDEKKFKKCPAKKRLLIYEGMAKWAEIQYLYLVGETDVAKREEFITRNRKDEYGLGFLMYESQYPISREAMTCESTPFTPGKYPFE